MDRAEAERTIRRQPFSGRPDNARLRLATWLAWSIWTLAVLLGVASLVFEAKIRSTPQEVTGGGLLAAGMALLCCTPGALIIARRPGNSVGWILCATGLGAALSGAAGGYGIYAVLTAPGSLPSGVAALWLSDLVYGPTLVLVSLLFVVFPDGRLPSRRWRPAVALLLVTIVGLGVLNILIPRPLGGLEGAPINPTGIPGAEDRLDPYITGGLLYLLLFMLAALLALRVRYEQAQAVERQQLKWFLYGAVALLITTGGTAFWVFGTYVVPVVLVGFGVFTTCIAVAILRHHLYDIDTPISRTLPYSLLSAILGLGYIGPVLLLRQLPAGSGGSGLAVAASTLAVAAVFQPARRRIQGAVDRRYNRRHYDAARTIDAFSVHLRQQLDLEALTAELMAVVEQTMQPHSAFLWLAERQSKKP
jgi:hypothetical protein